MSRWTMPFACAACESPGDLHRQLLDFLDRQALAAQPRLERFALDQLHRNERVRIRLADVVDHRDIRVVERGRGPGLLDEALLRGLELGDVRGEELEGDEALESGILRLVHDSHPTFAKLVEDEVMGNG